MSGFDPFLSLARQAKKRHMEMQCKPDDVLRLYEQRDELLAALEGLISADSVTMHSAMDTAESAVNKARAKS